jgi:hypothetical protein
VAEPSLALQKALLSGLSTISAPTYSAVAQGTPYPYVTVDRMVAARIPFLESRKQERFVFLTVWSETKGHEEVLRIMGEIDAALHGVSFTLDTGRMISIQVEDLSTDRDADDVTFRGTVTLRVLTEH